MRPSLPEAVSDSRVLDSQPELGSVRALLSEKKKEPAKPQPHVPCLFRVAGSLVLRPGAEGPAYLHLAGRVRGRLPVQRWRHVGRGRCDVGSLRGSYCGQNPFRTT